MTSSTARRTITVTAPNGLHMVPCSLIARFVQSFTGPVRISHDDVTADARSILDLLQLKAECGNTLVLEADGEGAAELLDGLVSLFDAGFPVDTQRSSGPDSVAS